MLYGSDLCSLLVITMIFVLHEIWFRILTALTKGPVANSSLRLGFVPIIMLQQLAMRLLGIQMRLICFWSLSMTRVLLTNS
jgi:hypothetical protein